jgi:hypothetical protein
MKGGKMLVNLIILDILVTLISILLIFVVYKHWKFLRMYDRALLLHFGFLMASLLTKLATGVYEIVFLDNWPEGGLV